MSWRGEKLAVPQLKINLNDGPATLLEANPERFMSLRESLYTAQCRKCM